MNIDLNIDNYQYNDLLNIFKISNNSSIENIEKMTKTLDVIRDNYSDEITVFFTKAYNIIYSIFNLHNLKIIKNNEMVNDYYIKIKEIDNLENKNIDEIISLFNDSYIESYKNILFSEKRLSSKDNRSLYNNVESNNIENTYNNNVAPGNINSIKRITQVSNLYLNSCFRNNYFNSLSSDFQYNIPNEIKNVVSMRLVSIEIPNSWYLISKNNKNDFFELMITLINKKDVESKTYKIEIPEGNYTSSLLEDFLNTTYFYKSENDNLLKFIKFSISKYNNKTSFEILNNDVTISLMFSKEYNENPLSTFGWLCGFRMTNYLNITKHIISEGLFDDGSDNYLYVIINDYQYNNNNLNIVGFDKSVLNENVISKIILKDKSNEHKEINIIRNYNGPVNISKLHIKIIDKYGNVINLNNMDISLTVEFEILYESFNFKNISD